MVMVITVDGHREPVLVCLEQGDDIGFTSIEIPGNMRDRGVEVVFAHVSEQLGVSKVAVWFSQQGIVHRKICVMPVAMPRSFSCSV